VSTQSVFTTCAVRRQVASWRWVCCKRCQVARTAHAPWFIRRGAKASIDPSRCHPHALRPRWGNDPNGLEWTARRPDRGCRVVNPDEAICRQARSAHGFRLGVARNGPQAAKDQTDFDPLSLRSSRRCHQCDNAHASWTPRMPQTAVRTALFQSTRNPARVPPTTAGPELGRLARGQREARLLRIRSRVD